MYPFNYYSPATITEASSALKKDPGSMVVAGSTDLLSEMKEGVVRPSSLISLTEISSLRDVTWNENGLSIGAMVTLTEIASDPMIRRRCSVLSEASETVATLQIRNIGTLGGNLCQRPRCWYYRSPQFNCLKKGGDHCFALGGIDRYHAILGGSRCFIVHPSDVATGLLSVSASVTIYSEGSMHTLPLSEFFVGPESDVTRENILSQGDLMIAVNIPSFALDRIGVYLKSKERQSMDFALASAAVSIENRDDLIVDAGVAVGGIAPVPLTLAEVEGHLINSRVGNIDLRDTLDQVFSDARPMSTNGYKISLAKNYLRRAITQVFERM